MRKLIPVGIVLLATLAGCGLESLFSGLGHSAYEQPASRLVGSVPWTGSPVTTFVALDGEDNELVPFQASASGGSYDVRLKSASYQMIRVQGRAGALALRALIPQIGEEITQVADLDARHMTETLIVEAWGKANNKSLTIIGPAAYVGDGKDSGTRTLIYKAFDVPGPTQDLLRMVERLIGNGDTLSGAADPDLFLVPDLDAAYTVTSSPLGNGFLARNPFDYDGDGLAESDSAKFDLKLSEVAPLYSPPGCLDPDNIRVVFQVDFNQGALSGTCGTIDRFKWAKDKPDKQMFFVAWVHNDSLVPADVTERAALNTLVGGGVPNQLAMYDDGTNGDEVSGDGICAITFVVPEGVRLGYKYTWGIRGQGWTGSEEWPGNSRIIEVVDVNGDDYVVKRDVFADEATNKDKANLNPASGGTLDWDEALRGCGPEAREQKFTLHSACGCGDWQTPTEIGPATLACTAGP